MTARAAVALRILVTCALSAASVVPCVLILVGSCAHPHQVAPKPPVITVIHEHPMCKLPSPPMPAVLGGVPEIGGQHWVLTQDGVAEIHRYFVDSQAWIKAANDCIGAEPWQERE